MNRVPSSVLMMVLGTAAVAPMALAQTSVTTSSEIARQPLAAALSELARENGLQVVYVSAIADGLSSPAIPAGTPVDEALALMLANTGLTHEFINERTVRIVSPGAASETGNSNATAGAVTTAGTAADTAAPLELAEIVVTARKRSESLLETPLSVQAFSSEDIESAGLRNLEDVASLTAGLDFQKLGNSQAGRYNTAIRFRGLELLVTTPSSQTGALFVDGVFVLGGAGSVGFTDVERIEVIRGPQAAYFGRGTFGGAINYVTKDPSFSPEGSVAAEYSPNFGSSSFQASLEGGLTDTISGRISASSRKRGAMFTATDGGKLGEERSDMVSGTLLWTPTDDLRVRMRGVYGEDNDGPASTTYIRFEDHGNCGIGTPVTVDTTSGLMDVTLQRNLHCGALPENIKVTNNTHFYTVNTAEGPVNTRDILVGMPGLPGTNTPRLEEIGLKSIYQLWSLSADYAINDAFDLTTLFGYNHRASTSIRDDDNYDSYGRITHGFLELESKSAEMRVNYDDDGRLRAMLGVNYYTQKQRGDVDGGVSVLTNLFGMPFIGTEGGAVDSNDIDTIGYFGSIEYDVFDWLTLSAEGRYQIDKLTSYGGIFPGPYTTRDEEYTDFLPRFLATFRPMDGTTIYASYAEGALPGSVNAVFATLDDAERDVILDLVPGLSPALDSQTLESWELGWKQRLGEQRRAWFSLTAYKMDWTNVPGSAQITFLSPTDGAGISTSVFLPGDVELEGFEAEMQWLPLDQLDLRASASYSDAKYTDFQSASLNSYFGLPAGTIYRADGNRLPRSPREQVALSATWTDAATSEWDWYIRGDASYSGKTYTDETNLSWVRGYTLVNARLGLTRGDDGFNVELYCTNCLQEEGWRTGRRGSDFGDTSPIPNLLRNIGAVVQPLERREFGLRVQYDF